MTDVGKMKGTQVKTGNSVQIDALSEAIGIIRKARFENAVSNEWAWQFLNHSGNYLSKQHSALCQFHFSDDVAVDAAERDLADASIPSDPLFGQRMDSADLGEN